MRELTSARFLYVLSLLFLMRVAYVIGAVVLLTDAGLPLVLAAISEEAQVLALAAVLGTFGVRQPLAGQLGALVRALDPPERSAYPALDAADDATDSVRRRPTHLRRVHRNPEDTDLKPLPLLLEALGLVVALVGLAGLLFFARYLGDFAYRTSIAELVGVETIYGLDGNTSLLLGLAGISIWFFAWVFESTRFA